MNQETDSKELFLFWQGQVTGPHTLREVRNLLKLGKIHSLYKIQVEGQWVLLRDNLAALEKDAREEAAARSARAAQLQAPSPLLAKPIATPDGDCQIGKPSRLRGTPSRLSSGSSSMATASNAIAAFNALQNMRIMHEMQEANQHLKEIGQDLSHIEHDLSDIEEGLSMDIGNFLDF